MFYRGLFRIQLLQENLNAREPNQPALPIIYLVKSSRQTLPITLARPCIFSVILDELTDRNNKIIGSSYQILLH